MDSYLALVASLDVSRAAIRKICRSCGIMGSDATPVAFDGEFHGRSDTTTIRGKENGDFGLSWERRTDGIDSHHVRRRPKLDPVHLGRGQDVNPTAALSTDRHSETIKQLPTSVVNVGSPC